MRKKLERTKIEIEKREEEEVDDNDDDEDEECLNGPKIEFLSLEQFISTYSTHFTTTMYKPCIIKMVNDLEQKSRESKKNK